MRLVRQMRGGKDYDAQFGRRMRGEGPFADLIAARFANAHRRLGFGRMPALDTTQFIRSEEHTSELQSLMRISYAVFCLKKKKTKKNNTHQLVTYPYKQQREKKT